MSEVDELGEHPDAEHAEIISQCIGDLLSESPGDDRFRLLNALSFSAIQVLGESSPKRFAADVRDPEMRQRLLDSPAAVPLLMYLWIALDRYNAKNSNMGPTTADRRDALADAFYLTGKPGEQWQPSDERMGLAFNFATNLGRELPDLVGLSPSEHARAVDRAKIAALRRTYHYKHGHEFLPDDDTHKSRLATIRSTLREMGYGFVLGEGRPTLPAPLGRGRKK